MDEWAELLASQRLDLRDVPRHRGVYFSPRFIWKVADTAAQITGGRFRMAPVDGLDGVAPVKPGADPDGQYVWTGPDILRYADASDASLVWAGDTAGRCAAAYYSGAALEWARRTVTRTDEDTRRLAEQVRLMHTVQQELYKQAAYREWMDRGRTAAVGLRDKGN